VGAPEAIYERPQTRFAAQFIGQTNLLDGEVLSIQDECVRMRIGDEITCAALGGYAPKAGETVSICLRTERVHLSKQPCEGALTGTVTDRHYAGGAMRVTVQTAGQTLYAQVEDAAAFAPGEAAYISWDAHAAAVVPGADA